MKRFLLLAVAALAFVGCNNAFEDEGNARFEQTALPTLMAGFEDADTRTYVENNKYLRWHEGDLISAFVGDTRNCKYQFEGKTGDNSGTFVSVESSLGSSEKLDRIYALYPYDKSATITTKGVISCSLSAIQTYATDSFAQNVNTMVSATSGVNDGDIIFKNVGGYLKVKLYSDAAAVVKSITIRGNNGEKIAGNANINATYGGVPKIAMADDATESIMLDCGYGVMLSSDAENPTEFWFVVPPTEFSKGITISVTSAYNAVFEKSTSNKIVVERNMIQPMTAVEVLESEIAKPANNEIWYTATKKVEPYYDDEFGATLLSNIYDSTTKEGVLTFDSYVTQIGDKAFYRCNSLTSITIPDSVTAIGEAVFCYCSSLTSITIPDSVTTIRNSAFAACDSLTSVTIPDSVTTIGDWAFWSCDGLTSVTIGDSVTTIGRGAFASCDSLTSVTIPDSVTTIGNSAFYYCYGLTSVTIGDSVTTIGAGTFYYCDSLKEFKGKYAADNGRCLIKDNTIIAYAEASGTEYTIPDSVNTIGENVFCYCDSLTSITIPNSVTTIGDSAFEYCSSLTSVTIPDSVTTIGDDAFFRCYSLTSVTIGDSVTTIGEAAFYGCDSLTSVTIGDSVTSIGDMAFGYCDSLTSVTIGDSVTTIGNSAFYYCYGLTSVTIGDSVITIGVAAFASCDSLKEFKGKFAGDNGRCLIKDNTIIAYAEASGTEYTIPDSVTTIGDYAFCDCKSLTSITIPDSVTTIGNSTFYDCDSLTSVIIGDSVTEIEWSAFAYCDKIKYIYCKPTTPPTLYSNSFSSDVAPTMIYVPTNSVNAYKTAEFWSNYADVITGFNF